MYCLSASEVGVGFWQNFDIRPDPWALEYELPIALEENQAPKQVKVDVEAVPWQAIAPPTTLPLPPILAFVDGRRRLDGRAVGKDGDRILYGAFATVAAGTIEIDCHRQQAYFPQDATVERVIAFGGDRQPESVRVPGPPGSRCRLQYDPTPQGKTASKTQLCGDPQLPLVLVQERMREIEADLAVAQSRNSETLVIQDGNLFRDYDSNGGKTGTIVGYMKTLQRSYLPAENARLLWQLQPGERTPLFSVGRGSFRYWSWYLRSGRVGQGSLHGIVRLEIFASKANLDWAQRIADWSCYLVPKYASEPLRDPRAPQNLMPINALESWLGRHMGSAALAQRCVKQFLQGVKNGE